MKQRNIFLILLFIGVVGFFIYGYFKAIPEVNNERESISQIEATPISHDFGEIEYGDVMEYTFKIKNTGDEVLEIKRLSTSCGCTTVKIDKEQIDSQEEVNLYVTYDSGAMSGSHAKGDQERIIFIKTNDPINPQIELIINAYVK